MYVREYRIMRNSLVGKVSYLNYYMILFDILYLFASRMKKKDESVIRGIRFLTNFRVFIIIVFSHLNV